MLFNVLLTNERQRLTRVQHSAQNILPLVGITAVAGRQLFKETQHVRKTNTVVTRCSTIYWPITAAIYYIMTWEYRTPPAVPCTATEGDDGWSAGDTVTENVAILQNNTNSYCMKLHTIIFLLIKLCLSLQNVCLDEYYHMQIYIHILD